MNTPRVGLVHPYVDSATLAGNKFTFRVEVSEYGDIKGSVEITGEATQPGGALALISSTVPVPLTPNGRADEPDEEGRYFVEVAADAIPPYPFRANVAITVVVRVSRIWATVLAVPGGAAAELVPQKGPNDEAAWDKVILDARVGDKTWPSSSAQ